MDRWQGDQDEVTCLVDGVYDFDDDDFPEVSEATRAARLSAAGLKAIRTEFNAYVLRHAGGVDLVDTGCGVEFGTGAGRLLGLLADAGVFPGDVGRIILTHMHTDHAGGLMDDGAPVFPDAQIILHADEMTCWAGSDGYRAAMLEAYADQFTTVDDGDDMGHGIKAWALPGHTPGHMGLRIAETVVLVGDVIHSEALQFQDVTTRNANDMDRASAERSRKACLDEIVDDGLIWSGSHMLGPDKFARLVRDGDGFQRVPL